MSPQRYGVTVLTVVALVMLSATSTRAQETPPPAAETPPPAAETPPPAAETPPPAAERETPFAAAPSGIESHLAGLEALDPVDRIAAVRALGESRDQAAVGPLAQVLRSDPSPEVRGWAIRALMAIGTPEARSAVATAAQQDSDERVRSLAVEQLGTAASAPWSPSEATAPPQQRRGPFGPGIRQRRQRRHPGLGLLIAGWSVFGVTYLASLIAGAATTAEGDDSTWPLFLPVAGPIIEAAFIWDDPWGIAPLGALALLDGLAQIAGLTLAIIGHVRRSRHRESAEGEDSDEAAPVEEARSRFTLSLLPGGPAGSTGLGLVGTF